MIGSPETLRLKDKIFAVERRGGYPWAEGYFGRNDTAPLPLRLTGSRPTARLTVRICDDCAARADHIRQVYLRCILFGARDQEQLNVQWNGVALRLAERDPAWKDPQIFSPAEQPPSGGPGYDRVNPSQRLLRLEFAIDPRLCQLGKNQLTIRLADSAMGPAQKEVAIEKLDTPSALSAGKRALT